MSDSKVPDGLRYAKTHEWVKVDGETVTVGITDHAQAELTDIVFADLPAVGKAAQSGTPVMVLESVKTVADIYAPGTGSVVDSNAELRAHPEFVNQDPYGKGWLFRLRLSGPLDPALMDAAGYLAFVASGA
ncbi:MAG: glycine cleavage system protein GcvH [Thermoplasmata archaeon]|nr:glycine cleavage system protein GcvH [Thermoplasmata archaeon]